MSRRKPARRSHRPRSPDASSPSAGRRSAVLLPAGFILSYWVLYFGAPIPAGEATLTRLDYVLHALIFERSEVVDDWFGTDGNWAVSDRLPILALAAATLLVAQAAGRLLLDAMGLSSIFSRGERFVFAIACGLGLVSHYVLAVGLAGLLQSRWAYAVPACLVTAWAVTTHPTALLRAVSARRWSARRAHKPTADASATRCPLRPLIWLAVPFGVVTIAGGLLPPLHFDVREYHAQVPKEFFQQGRITFLPYNVYGNMPLAAETLGLPAMAVTGDWWIGTLVGKTLIAAFAPLVAVALWSAGKRFFTPEAGTVAAVCAVSTPWIARVSNLGLNEGAVGFFGGLALYAAALSIRHSQAPPGSAGKCRPSPIPENEQERADPAAGTSPPKRPSKLAPAGRLILLAGLMAGWAAACKYPALLFVVGPLLGLLLLQHRQRWRGVLAFLLGVALTAGPWLGKNAVLAGNPVYPLLHAVFGGQTRTAELDARWRNAHRPPNFAVTDLGKRLADFAWRSLWMSPIAAPLACLAALSRFRRAALWLGLYLLVVFSLWWLLTHRLDRFLVPVLPVLAMLAGIGATWNDQRNWQRVLLLVVLIGCGVSFTLIAGPVGGYTKFLAPLDQLRTDPQRVNRWHLWLNEQVEPPGGVLLVGDAQVFDLEVPTWYHTTFDPCPLEVWSDGGRSAALHKQLAGRKIRYVYIHWPEIARYRSPGNYGYTDFVTRRRVQGFVEAGVLFPPEPAGEGRLGEVYRVRPLPGDDLR